MRGGWKKDEKDEGRTNDMHWLVWPTSVQVNRGTMRHRHIATNEAAKQAKKRKYM